MMRTSTFWQVLALSLLAHTASVSAQTPSSSTATTSIPGLAPVPAPPQMERLEEMTEAPITVTPQGNSDTKIEERREQGRVTEVKVTSGGSTYYMKPNTPAGTAAPGDVTGSANRGPQWKVFEFDFGSTKKTPEQEEAGSAATPAP
jgi:hypothetical protein